MKGCTTACQEGACTCSPANLPTLLKDAAGSGAKVQASPTAEQQGQPQRRPTKTCHKHSWHPFAASTSLLLYSPGLAVGVGQGEQALVDLDAGQDALRVQAVHHLAAVAGLLEQGLLEQDGAWIRAKAFFE